MEKKIVFRATENGRARVRTEPLTRREDSLELLQNFRNRLVGQDGLDVGNFIWNIKEGWGFYIGE